MTLQHRFLLARLHTVAFASGVALSSGGGSIMVAPAPYKKATHKALVAAMPDAGADDESETATALADIVFTTAAVIEAGAEKTKCSYVAMPDDRGEIAVPSAESRYTPGSHHFLVYRTDLDQIPDGKGEPYECPAGGLDAHVTGSYYEAQSPETHRVLPKGVAHIFRPGEVVLLTSHYVNTTTSDLDAHLTFTLHTVERDSIEQEAGSIFFYNPQISLPPHSDRTVTRTCPISADMNLGLLWSHMHKQGVGFTVTTDDADADNPLYATKDWSEPLARVFPYDPPVTVHAGSSITYACDYHNATDDKIVAGQSAQTNEMCILHGMYWPRASGMTELCMNGKSSATDPVDEQ
jgi:hypothetical protein